MKSETNQGRGMESMVQGAYNESKSPRARLRIKKKETESKS